MITYATFIETAEDNVYQHQYHRAKWDGSQWVDRVVVEDQARPRMAQTIAEALHAEGPHVMEDRLRSEGVTFDEEGCVDLERHLWVPTPPREHEGVP